jgi:hypothetical protein
MYAIEFEACIDNGVVLIPERYKTLRNNKRAKIIVMVDEPVEEKNESVFAQFLQKSGKVENLTPPTKRVSALSIDTRSFKFNREDANAR